MILTDKNNIDYSVIEKLQQSTNKYYY